METGLELVSAQSVVLSNVFRMRNQNLGDIMEYNFEKAYYDILLKSEIFHKPREVEKRPSFSAIGMPDDTVNVEFPLQHWHLFENSVWQMFALMNPEAVNRNHVAIKITDEEFFMSNGIFVTTNHVFVIRTFYSQQERGLDVVRPNLCNDAIDWKKSFDRVEKFLSESFLECRGKRLVPLLVTRGYSVTRQQSIELKQNGIYHINDRFVQELTRLSGKNGLFGLTVLCQELFRGETLPYEVGEINALMETIDGARVFNFFANAKEIVDTMYVHRRLPQDSGYAMAYQRMVKPDKVLEIMSFLENSGSFFPNSIVVAIEDESYEKVEGNFVRLKLPNVYGNMWIIDGQHRLYGTAFSDSSKPVAICAIQGLDGILQAKQFTAINSNQTKVSKDLIWDLKGELYSGIHNPADKDEEVMQREYFVSNVWKYVNTHTESPLNHLIKIPSQSPMQKVGYGSLCKNINSSKLWKEGVLIKKQDNESVITDSGDLLISFFGGINSVLTDEWNKPFTGSKERKNWVLNTYSLEIFCKLFIDGAIYFSSNKSFVEQWNNESALILMHSLGESVALATQCDSYGFFAGDKNIKNAGNAGIRKEYYTDLVISMRDSEPNLYSPEFAPGVGFEDYTTLDFSPKIKKLIHNIEVRLRDLCSDVLETEGSGDITSYLSEQYRRTIENSLKQEKNWTDVSLFGGRKKLEYLSLSDLQEIITKKKYFSMLEIQPNLRVYDEQFRHVKLVRNGIAHARDFPDHKAKRVWTAATEQVWDWLKETKLKSD